MCNTVVRPLIVVILFSLTILVATFLFIFSFVQIPTRTKTNLYELPKNPSKPNSSPCDVTDGYSSHRPFTIRFGNDTKTLQCPWGYENTVPRIGGTLLIAVVSLFVIVGVLLKRRIILWIVTPMVAVLSIGFIAMGIADVVPAGRSLSWCNEGMKGATRPTGAEGEKYVCVYWTYGVTVAADWVLAAIGIISCIFVLHMSIFKWKKFVDHGKGVDLQEFDTSTDNKRLSRVQLFDRKM